MGLLSSFFSLFSIAWFSLNERDSTWLARFFCEEKHKKIWMTTSLCLFWIVRRERNKTVFDDETQYVQEMKSSFSYSLWSWSSLVTNFEPVHITNFHFFRGMVRG